MALALYAHLDFFLIVLFIASSVFIELDEDKSMSTAPPGFPTLLC